MIARTHMCVCIALVNHVVALLRHWSLSKSNRIDRNAFFRKKNVCMKVFRKIPSPNAPSSSRRSQSYIHTPSLLHSPVHHTDPINTDHNSIQIHMHITYSSFPFRVVWSQNPPALFFGDPLRRCCAGWHERSPDMSPALYRRYELLYAVQECKFKNQQLTGARRLIQSGGASDHITGDGSRVVLVQERERVCVCV